MNDFRVSAECLERLGAWAAAHPRPLEEPQYVAGLVFVVRAEVERALQELCRRRHRKIGEPCRH